MFRYPFVTWMLLAVLASFTDAASADGVLMCVSPDGQNTITFRLANGIPHYDVTYAGQAVIREAALGLNLVAHPFGAFQIVNTDVGSVDTAWKPVVGERETVHDHYRHLTVELQERDVAGRRLNIEFRAYNEGVAFRYVLPKQPTLDGALVSSEATEFRFTGNFGAYPITSTEAHYHEEPTPISACNSVLIPLTIDLANGAMAALIEAHVAKQPPCILKKKDEHTLRPHFRKGNLTLATPEALTWRGLILAPNTAGLIENRYLVENLNPPCAIEDTSWIKPGKFIDRCGPISTENIKKNMDFAAAHHLEYVHIDWSWYGTERKWSAAAIAHFKEHMPESTRQKLEGTDWIHNTQGNPMIVASGYVPYLQFQTRFYNSISHIDLDMPEVIRYGKQKGVGLSLYVNGGVLKPYGDHDVDLVFKTLAGWGVTALKPGFVACSSQEDIQWLRQLVAIAAKYKLVLNIHDGYIADGMRRTYPNLLTQEGGGGRETRPTVTHELMLPFTRHLVGAHDHTPTLYSGQDGRTKLFELAQLVVYHGARQSIRNVYASRNQFGVEMEFLEKVPTVWGDVAVLKAAPRDCVVIARRNGQRWFLGGMNDEEARELKLPLRFLDKGTAYHAIVFSDVAGSRDARRDVIQATSESILDVSFQPRGGVAAIIEPVDPAVHVVPDRWMTTSLRGPIVHFIDVEGKDTSGLSASEYARSTDLLSNLPKPALLTGLERPGSVRSTTEAAVMTTSSRDTSSRDAIMRNWPNLRGPFGQGIGYHVTPPTDFDAASGKNVRWKTPTPRLACIKPRKMGKLEPLGCWGLIALWQARKWARGWFGRMASFPNLSTTCD